MVAVDKKATFLRQTPHTAHCKPHDSVSLSGPYTFLCRHTIRSSDFPGDISAGRLCDCRPFVSLALFEWSEVSTNLDRMSRRLPS
jgi:hypothetical protein